MAGLRDITDQATHDLLANNNFTAGGLVINAAGATSFKSALPYQYMVDGIFKAKAALAAQAFSPHPQQNIGITQYYAIGLDGSGNVTTYQGGEETFILNAIPTTVPTLPSIPSGICPIGVIKIVSTSAPFLANTTPLDTVGLAVTYYDVSLMPTVPM